MASPADLIRKRARFDLTEIAHATAFIRGGRRNHPRRAKPTKTKSSGLDWQERLSVENAARAELLRMSDDWHVLDRLTPWQMAILFTVASEGNAERAAYRLCITTQTLKNHLTNIRKAVYGNRYHELLDHKQSSNGPLIAMAVRYALDYEARLGTLPTDTYGDSGEREQG